jgi:inner membrane protein
MSPITHFLTGWAIANIPAETTPRDRCLISVSAVIADVDGFGIVIDFLTTRTTFYQDFHHTLGHNLLFGIFVTLIFSWFASRKFLTGILVFICFHLHLLEDLIGSRSPDGYQWPIPYLWPFTSQWHWTWSGQWELNAWQNFLITGFLLVTMFWLAIKRGFSPLETISSKADSDFIHALRRRLTRTIKS